MDLNSDLGEGFGPFKVADDEAMLHLVTSANLACGFHGGDPLTMQQTASAAAQLGVTIGAHPSYPDLVGFGRRDMDLSNSELIAALIYQIGALDAIARAVGSRVQYVKAHGALYHKSAKDPNSATALMEAVSSFEPSLAILGPPNSEIVRAAERTGINYYSECFVDRRYRGDGSLVPRGTPDAVITDPDEVVFQALRLSTEGVVKTVEGSEVKLHADSLCIHGDTDGALRLAELVRNSLRAADIPIRPFCSG